MKKWPHTESGTIARYLRQLRLRSPISPIKSNLLSSGPPQLPESRDSASTFVFRGKPGYARSLAA